jgi:hypothetical protein
MNLIYNENKYILKFEKDVISIGSIQENILKTCSLMIYNIENTELFLKNGKSFILGSEQCIFKEILSNFIKNNVEEIIPSTTDDDYLLKIDKFIVYDRKRDEKGNVIKNNIIIDNYNTWFQENENLKYLKQSQYNTNQSTHQNNNIISLFSNIFEQSLLNHQSENNYINSLFRNYVNVNNERLPTTPNEEQPTTPNEEQPSTPNEEQPTTPNEEQEDENIQPINATINEIQMVNITDPIINDLQIPDIRDPIINEVQINNINNDEFSNMVNIFDTYINNSSREEYINNSRNSILYNYFNNMYSTVNIRNSQNNNNIEVNNIEVNNDETYENNNNNIELNNDVNEFLTENNINTFINNAPIFNIIRNMSNNIEIDEPTIINSNDDYITFSVPISIYNNNTQHNFEDVVVSLTDDEFNELTCYECNDENNEKDCNICIECFNKGDSIVKLNCNHEFHKDCIKKWLCDNSTKCPVCRVEVAKGKANL